MPSHPDSIVSFRDIDLAVHLDGYEGREHRHKNAKRLLRRYQWLMEAALAGIAMQPSAAVTLWSELDGCPRTHPQSLPILQQSIASALHEQGHEALALSVREMLPCQWVATVDACDRVRGSSSNVENLEDELRRVGLCK